MVQEFPDAPALSVRTRIFSPMSFPCWSECVNKGRHHDQPGMGDQLLPVLTDRKGHENSDNLGTKSASTTLLPSSEASSFA
ncbi:hypothetical protein [Arthrobacter sp. Z4-13]